MRDLVTVDWGRLDYGEALERQKRLVERRIAGECPDHLIFVEHPPTVTLGRSGSPTDLCASEDDLARRGVALFRVERGGLATYHGPGQLVAYPVVKLASRDLHDYLQRLLDTAARVLQSYGLSPQYRQGRPGLWVGEAKIASVGIAVRKWVTYHGIALNADMDLDGFRRIVVCGRADEAVTSMARELATPVELSRVKERFSRSFREVFGYGSEAPPPRRHPPWLVRPAANPAAVDRMEKRLERLRLATVCQSARCPNLGECFERGTATFMILGTRCTRRCRFCAVDKGAPLPPDPQEPRRVAQAVVQLYGRAHGHGRTPRSAPTTHGYPRGRTHGSPPATHEYPRGHAPTSPYGRTCVSALPRTQAGADTQVRPYVVVTSVTRDDLPDGGASHFAETVFQIRKACPEARVEVLIPDFLGDENALQTVCDARPDVLNHNIETVPRLYPRVRPRADYARSLSVLSFAAHRGLIAKSGLMLGLGETTEEVRAVLRDLLKAGCRSVTIGQYLSPSGDHAPVVRYVPPEEFDGWAETARAMGFHAVASAPLVRSSYRAGEMLAECSQEEPCLHSGK